MCAEQRVGVHHHGLGALGNDLVDSRAEPSRWASGHAQRSQTPGGTAAFSRGPVRGLRRVVLVEQDGDATVTLRREQGEAQRIPLAAVKEARLAFRF